MKKLSRESGSVSQKVIFDLVAKVIQNFENRLEIVPQLIQRVSPSGGTVWTIPGSWGNSQKKIHSDFYEKAVFWGVTEPNRLGVRQNQRRTEAGFPVDTTFFTIVDCEKNCQYNFKKKFERFSTITARLRTKIFTKETLFPRCGLSGSEHTALDSFFAQNHVA